MKIVTCITCLKENKSLSNDGLTGELFKSFSLKGAPFLLVRFCESIEKGELPSSLKQSLIILIPKANKDQLHTVNWRPVSLLNNDCKLFIYAEHIYWQQ